MVPAPSSWTRRFLPRPDPVAVALCLLVAAPAVDALVGHLLHREVHAGVPLSLLAGWPALAGPAGLRRHGAPRWAFPAGLLGAIGLLGLGLLPDDVPPLLERASYALLLMLPLAAAGLLVAVARFCRASGGAAGDPP